MSTNYKILWQQLARHLINKKPFKHRDEVKMDQRFRAYSPDLGHDSRYGCWIDPFEFVSKIKRKSKTYEYY